MKAVVTGATGLVGRALLARLENPVVLSRRPEVARNELGASVAALSWQPLSEPAPAAAFAGADVVFHLAGESLASGRWTKERKQLIYDSRVLGTENLVATLKQLDRPPRVLVSISAVGFYGERGDDELDEQAARGEGFLAELCEAWEARARQAAAAGIRVLLPRLGVVLSAQGGALPRMLLPFQLGVGGRLGSGRQWMPWVHIDDVVGLCLHAVSHPDLEGPINVVSPGAVTNAQFTKALGSVLHRPTLLPVPAPVLRAVFGEMSEALLGSQRVMPRAAERTGYRFEHPEVTAALAACLQKKR